MNTLQAIKLANLHLKNLEGLELDLLSVSQPQSIDSAKNLAKIISKLSPILGNLIEFDVVDFLNKIKEFNELGVWKRQDPGFPDAIFEGEISPAPGFEVKAWFPMATEITARFKDSQNHFLQDETYVCMLSWMPEFIIYGKPKVIGVCIVSGASVAQARDNHYHNPPDYLVLEPEDTSLRTKNLQQSNTNGLKFQGSKDELEQAKKLVSSWGSASKKYSTTKDYQNKLLGLTNKYKYRLDTNFAKMNRIKHTQIDTFKKDILALKYCGKTINDWSNALNGSLGEEKLEETLKEVLSLSKK